MRTKTAYGQLEYVGVWKRLLAYLVDIVIFLPLLPLSKFLLLYSFQHRTILPQIVMGLMMLSFWIFVTTKFGGTPGKLLLKLRVVNDDQNFISFFDSFLRVLPWIAISLVSYLELHYAISSITWISTVKSYDDAAKILSATKSIYGKILGVLVLIDLLVIIFNDKKRSLHDFIAGSYVVTKSSLEEEISPEANSFPQALLNVYQRIKTKDEKAVSVFVAWPLTIFLVLISIYDVITATIPFKVTIPALLYFLIVRFFVRSDSFFHYIFGSLIVLLVCTACDKFLMGYEFYRLRFSNAFVLGGGDVMLFMVIGAALGFYRVVLAFGFFTMGVLVLYWIGEYFGFGSIPAAWLITLSVLLVFILNRDEGVEMPLMAKQKGEK
ncbi:MAG: RDD family protein [Deltaproteobacteria bacterium]|nr:RDD family protein [Deltaproteobacteria bacterium]